MPDQLIDVQMPQFDLAVTEHLVIDAESDAVFEAARKLDFMSVRSPLVSAAFFVRGLPARFSDRGAPAPESLRLDQDQMSIPGWSLLGTVPGREICFGAVGKFWSPNIEWHEVPAENFAGFDDPGWGKIACQFLVRPDGHRRSIFTYETRVATTDELARRNMARYWVVIRPFVSHIMRATLRTVAGRATATIETSSAAGTAATAATREATHRP